MFCSAAKRSNFCFNSFTINTDRVFALQFTTASPCFTASTVIYCNSLMDKYHWIRQVIWAFEIVRKEEQKKFSKTHRRYFKNSKKLLLKRFNKSENEQQVLVMSETSANLSRSHRYKEKSLEILDCNDRETAKEKMQEWIYNASNCGIPQFEKCADSMQNRLTGILNSFSSP